MGFIALNFDFVTFILFLQDDDDDGDEEDEETKEDTSDLLGRGKRTAILDSKLRVRLFTSSSHSQLVTQLF